MGIPSYYKKLSDRTKGLISRSYEGKASALFFDFNCMIYHCARRPNSKLPPYPGPDGNDEWEELLLEDIVKYVVKVWQAVGQPKEVFLGIDGVVPMAKIKQQRMRRFKSIWLAEEEKKEGLRENIPSWDTNCITPGTTFMKKLTRRLQELCAKRPHWSISGAEEPGEGEHKVMAKLRERSESADPILIYGLDADLILLTLLNAKSPAYLVREDSEMGLVQLNNFGEEDYSYFSLSVLKQTLPPNVSIPAYVAAMSLLGNDFVPHSLTVKIKNDGHTTLLHALKVLETPEQSIVQKTDSGLLINHDVLFQLITIWAQEEYSLMLQTLKKKFMMAGASQKTLDNRPLEWMVEAGVLLKDDVWKLHDNWMQHYNRAWLQCERASDVDAVCREYLYGLQWVLDYYTGQRPVNMLWSFSRLLPPLWTDLAKYLRNSVYEPYDMCISDPIQPYEQLAMVLPIQSWHLQQESSFRSLPSLLPQFWPETFGFFSVGRTRMWECEALVPMLSVERVRSAVKKKRDCGTSK